MSLDSLYPYAGDHAIQNAVFAVEFEGVLTEKALQDVQKAAERSFGKEFPDVQSQQTMSVNFNFATGGPPQQLKAIPQPGGFVMSRPSGFTAVPARSITTNLNSCVILISDYSRWAQVKTDVDRYLDVLLKSLQLHGTALRAIGLQYTDVFNWKSDPADLVLGEVFDTKSPYVAANVFALPPGSLWHSHHGYFSAVDESVPYRQLDNINVNRIEVGGAHAIQILTSHRAQLRDAPWKISKENRPVISSIQEKLHTCNKVILGSLLSADVKSKIKMS